MHHASRITEEVDHTRWVLLLATEVRVELRVRDAVHGSMHAVTERHAAWKAQAGVEVEDLVALFPRWDFHPLVVLVLHDRREIRGTETPERFNVHVRTICGALQCPSSAHRREHRGDLDVQWDRRRSPLRPVTNLLLADLRVAARLLHELRQHAWGHTEPCAVHAIPIAGLIALDTL